mmetsp:Transcript_28378/g.44261  ORF Transcript_28378/g.44261 Transcript_28378/m.44261 type:complete len:128 (-) Transcript_28378:120-503(-)
MAIRACLSVPVGTVSCRGCLLSCSSLVEPVFWPSILQHPEISLHLLRQQFVCRILFLLTSPVRTVIMRTVLYGKKAANLYTQAFVQNTQARALYQESEDTYYRANDAASYDDWRRARHQWDYFYNRH